MTNKFDTIHNAMKELEEKIKKQGQIMFFEVAKEIFDKYPTVQAFSWNQYTPYFNDGMNASFQLIQMRFELLIILKKMILKKMII